MYSSARAGAGTEAIGVEERERERLRERERVDCGCGCDLEDDLPAGWAGLIEACVIGSAALSGIQEDRKLTAWHTRRQVVGR